MLVFKKEVDVINDIKYMIWDFDGTLVDTYPVMTKSLLKALGENGIITTFEVVYKELKVSLSHAITHFSSGNERLASEIRLRFAELESQEDPSAYEVFSDALYVLKTLKNAGITHFVLTHRNATTYKIMDACGMSQFIEDTVISDHGFKRKPDPEAFIYLLEKHGLDKNKTLSIGDRLFDVEAGKNAGLQGCLILDDYNGHLKNKAGMTVKSRMEILDKYNSK